MKRLYRPLAYAVSALLILMLLYWFQQRGTQPRQFHLLVINRSETMVEQVRLFGSALEQDVVLLNIAPQQPFQLEAPIMSQGTLKVEISQGLNRIDGPIVEDTRVLESFSQRLTIEPNNRFILGVEPQAAN